MSEEEVWALTLGQFQALRKRFDESRQASDLRAGVIAAAIYNTTDWQTKPSRDFNAGDFFPELRPLFAPRKMTPQEIMQVMRAAAPVIDKTKDG